MKTTRRKGPSRKGFYIAAALVLLAAGGIARITVEKTEKPVKPSDTTYTASKVESDLDTTDTLPQLTQSEPKSTQSDTAEISSETVSSVASDTQSKKVEQAATNEVLTFGMPIKGNIIKAFSTDNLIYSKTYGDMRAHTGIDILAEEGSSVKAAAKGTVENITDDPLLGKTVIIKHSEGIYSYYCGLNDVAVKKGDEVSMSKIVGTVGEIPSECLDESHLHFALKDKDGWLSPLEVMGLLNMAD